MAFHPLLVADVSDDGVLSIESWQEEPEEVSVKATLDEIIATHIDAGREFGTGALDDEGRALALRFAAALRRVAERIEGSLDSLED